MSRNWNWPEAMTEFVSARRAMPFAWGPNDCASFVADLGVAMGCPDLLAGLRGYGSALEAGRKLADAGYANLADMVASRLIEIAPGKAKRGDVALIEAPGREGIYRYTLAAFDVLGLIGPGEHELTVLPRTAAARAFVLV